MRPSGLHNIRRRPHTLACSRLSMHSSASERTSERERFGEEYEVLSQNQILYRTDPDTDPDTDPETAQYSSTVLVGFPGFSMNRFITLNSTTLQPHHPTQYCTVLYCTVQHLPLSSKVLLYCTLAKQFLQITVYLPTTPCFMQCR